MEHLSNPKLTPFSQQLRKSMTRQERRLWYDFLKALPVTVNRQKVLGPYIADFYCHSAQIVIEIDGSQHYYTDGLNHDAERDAFFRALGMKVLRYSNADVNQHFAAVCLDIGTHLFPENDWS